MVAQSPFRNPKQPCTNLFQTQGRKRNVLEVFDIKQQNCIFGLSHTLKVFVAPGKVSKRYVCIFQKE